VGILYNVIKYKLTRKPAKDVIKPSFVSSQAPPYSSSSTHWKLEKYTYTTPAFTKKNLKQHRRY
jgi:hypothetical protein